VILARQQLVWTSPDFSYALTLHNETDASVTVTADECAALVANLDPGEYQTTWNGTVWSTPTP
jgi:hypothetical protein